MMALLRWHVRVGVQNGRRGGGCWGRVAGAKGSKGRVKGQTGKGGAMLKIKMEGQKQDGSI